MAPAPPTPQEELKEGIQSYLTKVLEKEAQKDTLTGKATRYLLEDPPEVGLHAYLRSAFLYEWNLLGLLAIGGATTILAPWALPLVGAAELLYLGGLVSMPRFRSAIDRRYWERNRAQAAASAPAPSAVPVRPLSEILDSLPAVARLRFENLKSACVEMRDIARDLHGSASATSDPEMEQLLTGDLDRLLWTFLRYLIVQEGLERFQTTTDDGVLKDQAKDLESRIAACKESHDERMLRALTDSLATTYSRLENYQVAVGNAEFVKVELDRIEGKIRALTEITINRQDPGFISSQVDSVIQSIKLTEQTISELNLVTGLTDDIYETPPILELRR